YFFFFFSSRRRHTRSYGDWSSDVCSSDLEDQVNDLVARQIQVVNTRAGTLPLAGGTDTHPYLAKAPSTWIERTLLGIAKEFLLRSEERRVGKECSAGWWRED